MPNPLDDGVSLGPQPALGPVLLQMSNMQPPDALLTQLAGIERAIQGLRADLAARTLAGRLQRLWRWIRRR